MIDDAELAALLASPVVMLNDRGVTPAQAHLIAAAALMRRESRGGHYRHDFPRPKNKWRGRHIEF